MEERISRCENFGFINHVNAHGFENPCFTFVTNSGLGHDWDGCAVKNTLDHVWMTSTCNTACLANVCWNSLECHNGNSPCIFCDSRLFCINNVHDDAALLHSCKTTLDEVASVTKLGKVGTRHEYQSVRRFTPSRRLVKARNRIKSQVQESRLQQQVHQQPQFRSFRSILLLHQERRYLRK